MHTILVYSPQESLYPSIVMVIYSQFEASAPKLPLQVSLSPPVRTRLSWPSVGFERCREESVGLARN